jgi:hypothetical protein
LRGERPEDKRVFVRVPQRMKGGFLWHERLIYPRPCVVRDLSITGAKVEVLGEHIKSSILADGVRLYFSSEKHEIQCSVAWVKGQCMGLRFEGRARPPSRTYK